MPYHGLAGKKDAEAFLDRAVGIGHALVLPQVLAPGYDEEDFAEDGRVRRVLKASFVKDPLENIEDVRDRLIVGGVNANRPSALGDDARYLGQLLEGLQNLSTADITS